MREEELMKMAKRDLAMIVLNQNAQIDELKNQISTQTAIAHESAVEGYLVTAPNPNYNGTTLGVRFAQGRAFLSATRPNVEELGRKGAVEEGANRCSRHFMQTLIVGSGQNRRRREAQESQSDGRL